MKKLNKLLLVSLVLGALYLAYSAYYWGGAAGGSDTAAVGAGIALMLVGPHLAFTLIALVFNALGLFLDKAWAALVAGILYAVAMVSFPMYFFFVIVQMVLCFVAFAKMRQPKASA